MAEQIVIQSSEFGKSVAIYPRYRVLEDSTKAPKAAEVIYAGNAVSLNAPTDSTLIRTKTNMAVYGLAQANMNTYRDEVNDASFGIYGSGLMTVFMKGIVDVDHSYFPNTNGSYTTVYNYDPTITFVPGQPVYVDLQGGTYQYTITNVLNSNALTAFGTVLIAPNATLKTPLQILMK